MALAPRRDVRSPEREIVCLWRAVDLEGGILESYVTRIRDKAAALIFMKKGLKRHGSPEAITAFMAEPHGLTLGRAR